MPTVQHFIPHKLTKEKHVDDTLQVTIGTRPRPKSVVFEANDKAKAAIFRPRDQGQAASARIPSLYNRYLKMISKISYNCQYQNYDSVSPTHDLAG